MWKPLSDISPELAKAVIASEDNLFAEHNGFDWKELKKAIDDHKEKGKKLRGASTISQQTAKNVFLFPSRSFVRKAFEAYFTVLIEWIWGKERILEVYLNVAEMGKGISSMSELIIVTMLAGGLLELVRINGGLDYLIRIVTSRVRSRRGAEAAICMLTVLSNICTANNTIAILTVGDISRDIAHEFNIPARRSASLMDTTSCFVQGVIPYGAQLLMASGLAKVSPVDIISHLYYPMAVAIAVICSIVFTRNTAR